MNVQARGLVLSFCAAAVLASSARADLIGISKSPPIVTDLTIDYSTISYDASTKVLTIVGWPTEIDYTNDGPPDYGIVGGGSGLQQSAQIAISVNNLGTLDGGVPGDDLSIVGKVNAPGKVYGTLLTGEIAAFYYDEDAPHQLFELLFTVTGGSESANFGPVVGLVFDAVDYDAYGIPFTGSFASSFTNFAGDPEFDSPPGRGDIFTVPEPGSMLLLAAGMGMAGLMRRRTGTSK